MTRYLLALSLVLALLSILYGCFYLSADRMNTTTKDRFSPGNAVTRTLTVKPSATDVTALAAGHVLTSPIEHLYYLPLIAGPQPAPILIAAAHIDSAISGEADEAVLLWNTGTWQQPLAGWSLATTSRQATFPMTSTLVLAPGERLWCAAEAETFQLSFGELPACEWASDTVTTVLNLDGSLALPNSGGTLQLFAANGQLIDTLLYGDESRPAPGWNGAAAQLYTRGDIPREGQVWYRKTDLLSGYPLDSNRATDWSGDLTDLAWGRQVRMPGWQNWKTDRFLQTQPIAATGIMTVAIGPEGLYRPLAQLLGSARQSLDLSLYTLEHRELAELIAATAQRGVYVRLLLEGSPPGGISDFQKWCVATIAGAGGDVRYVAVRDEAPRGYRPRYRFLHAKYGIVDGKVAFSGTENLSYDAMPIDLSSPVGGRRGFYLLTDASPVVDGLQQIFTVDWAPEQFLDLFAFDPVHERYGGPPPDFIFPELPVYAVTEAPFHQAVVASGQARFQLLSAPEAATRPNRGLLALIEQAGSGDQIAVMQLYEHKHWGDSTSNPVADPNPRLQALLDAARRGAQVQILLDQYFDDSTANRSNQATVTYVNQIAATENLLLEARLGNPTLGGIHAKVMLFQIGEERWSGVGSLNGGEVSHKLNREVMVLTDFVAIHARLRDVFIWDWQQSGGSR